MPDLGGWFMNFVLAFIAFNFIVIIHELGHFIAAKKFGIKVLEFSLFVGPRIFSVQRGETTYSLRLFPIMAYVKMEGEEEASTSDRAFNNKPKHARAIVAAAAPFTNLFVAAIMLTIAFSLTGYDTTVVGDVAPQSPAHEAGIRKGDRITSYSGKNVYIPMDIYQFMFISKGETAKVEIQRGNEYLKTTITPLLIPEQQAYKLGIAVPQATGKDSNLIKTVFPGSAAEKAGLKENDRIIKLNDKDISNKTEIDQFMKENREKPLRVSVSRNGNLVSMELIPMVEKIPEQYDIGIVFTYGRGNVLSAFRQSIVFTYSTVRSIVYSVVWLITGKASLNQMMGPVGIVSTIGNVVQQGPDLITQLILLLKMTAFMSIAVGATNLIPFPMLDGNKLLLIGIEAVRRKPIPPEKEAFISMVGFVVLILFAIYAAYNDILRIINGG